MSTNKMYIICGMDEAGRGPAIGPLVFGLVLVTKEQEEALKQKGIKDSKTLTHKQRVNFARDIKKISLNYATLHLSASEIDEMRGSGTNLNKIEVNAFRKLVEPYGSEIAELQLDAADVNEIRFGNNFKDLVNAKIISKHKGDSLFISVSAASILAKVERDLEISKLQTEMTNFDGTIPKFGSGYPTDAIPFLTAYVKKYQKLPDIARKSWKTCIRILKEETGPKQMELDDW